MVPAGQELRTGFESDFVDFSGFTSVWTASSGVLKGCETPGVADDTADGIEMSPATGCLGEGGGGGAETVGLPSVL